MTDAPTLSAREVEVLFAAWAHCTEEKPKVDYNKLTEILGSKSVASATVTYRNALKKLTAGAMPASVAGAGGGGKGGAKKRAASEETPAPAKKKGKKAKSEMQEEKVEENEGEKVKEEKIKGEESDDEI